MKYKDIIKYLPYSLSWLIIVAMGILLLLQHTDFLFRAQEQSLFLPTAQFWNESTAVPGGWLTYAAAYLTQFFYHPVLGIAILVAMWTASVWLLAKGMRLKWEHIGLLALVPISLYCTIAQIGYSLFIMKLQGLLVVPTLAVLVISILVYLTSLLKGYWQSALVVLFAFVGYPTMGAYGILAPLIMAIWSERYIVNIVLSGVTSYIACLVYYHTHATVMMEQMIYAALPGLYLAKDWQSVYVIPYVGLLVGLLLPIISKLTFTDKIKMYVACGVALLSLGVVFKCNFSNNNFRRELQISKAMDQGDWYEVLNIVNESKKAFNPTRQIVFARNMALWRTGKLGDYAFSYTNETQKSKAPYELNLPPICGAQQYYYAGMPYFTYRWAMETCITYGWDVEGLKNFAKSAITVGEHQLALRYLNLLRQTMFHKEWAEYYYSLAKNPALIKEDKEIMWIRSLINYRNSLEVENGNTSDNIYDYYAGCKVNDSKIQEFGMISAMIRRDHKLFMERFIQYVQLNRDIVEIPKHYQEAALLMATLDNNEEMLNQPYSEEVVRTFELFKSAYQHTEHLPSDQQAATLWQQFGRTYYYYYTLNRGII
ncbi:MAG: DUF6057 family protein [Bacteroidales bacterium]|nr:DUF6057 family protein [Bacteroidales bacterium]